MSDFNEIYLDRPLRFSEGQCKYLSTTYNYTKYACRASEEYERMYKGYKSFKAFANSGIEDGYKLLGRYIEITSQELVAQGFYDVNEKVLVSEYGEFICEEWTKVENLVYELYKTSEAEVAEAERYRATRKASRGRFVGGGFGVKGAAKGIALAGAFNTISGLAHSGVNAIGNSNTRVTQQRKLNDIYNSSEMLQYLKKQIEISVQKLGAVLLEYQNLYLAENIVGAEDMKERARALRNNFSRVPDNEKPSVAIQMLMLDPLDLNIYEFLLQKYGDRDGVLYKLSEVIGFPGEYKKIVSKFRESVFANVKDSMCSELRQLRMVDENQGKIVEIRDKYKEKTHEAVSFYGGDIGVDAYLGELHQRYIKQLSELRESGFERLVNALDTEMRLWMRPDYTPDKILELKDRYYKKANTMIAFYEGDITSRPYYGRINSAIEKQFRLFIEYKYLSAQATNSTKSLSLAEKELHVLQDNMPKFLKGTVEEALKKINDISKRVDEKERTYLDTIFATIEKRQNAEAEYIALNQKYLAVISTEILLPSDKFKQLDEMRQEIEKNDKLDPCVKDAIMSQIDPAIKKLIKEDQERRTFEGKMFGSEEECNTVRQDYEKLTGKFTGPNAKYTLADLESSIKDCKKGNYHPVASQFALEVLEPPAKELRHAERATGRKAIAWGANIIYIFLVLIVFLTKPTFFENGQGQTLKEVVELFVSNDFSMHITLGNGIFLTAYVVVFGVFLSMLKEGGSSDGLALAPFGTSILLALIWVITFICGFFGVNYHCVSGFYWFLFGGLIIGITAYIGHELYQ